MGKILLQSGFHPETTTVSNVFIDKYMPAANGTYVKVYLYLLRHLHCGEDLSIDKIAEELDETEKDIKRAFTYWEKQKLLHIELDGQQAPSRISILDFENQEAFLNQKEFKNPEESGNPEEAVQKEKPAAKNRPPVPKAEPIKPNYTKEQIETLFEIEEIKWLMLTLEQYLEQLLQPSDIQRVLYFYEGLGFSAELILYLYEYCISNNKKSSHYIESVAHAWHSSGIDTVEKAEETSAKYRTGIQIVSSTFGLDRMLGSIEKKYVVKWFQSYGFDKEIIIEALNRTLLAKGKPDFKYADKILSNWYGRDVKTLLDLEVLDQEHKNKPAKQTAERIPAPKQTQAGNRFNAFPQRSHSNEYYETLEKQLLQNQQ